MVRELFVTGGVKKCDQNVNPYTLYFIKKSLLNDVADLNAGVALYLIADQ